MTFWDAGEFITAAWTFGIPHPPGTPLYVAIGHVWVMALAPLLGAARAMNLLSAVMTAAAGGMTAWLFVHEGASSDLPRRDDDTRGAPRAPIGEAPWTAVVAALCAGLMASAWSNATETEVYAIALLHAVLMLACAAKAGSAGAERARRWIGLTAYLILLAPAVHLSVLVAAPAAIALAARDEAAHWHVRRLGVLGGALFVAAGVGRMSVGAGGAGALLIIASLSWPMSRRGAARLLALLLVVATASSALLIMLVRARHDPGLNQGDPSTVGALLDVVARRQYDVAGLWPRRAPAWLQLANMLQYADWQVALGWGRGVFTSPARVAATLVYVWLAVSGTRSLRRDSRRFGDAMLILLLCGTLGVAAYLNLRAGASLGWGLLPEGTPHEARERDYFFVYGFWAWGCLAGYGAMTIVRARRWPAPAALLVAVLPLIGNWSAMNRRREPERDAARRTALAILGSAPRGAVLFLAGDNDSYPLWYAQAVEGARRDVTPVTLPLLSAEWYSAQVARRSGLRWQVHEAVPGATWRHEQQATLIARAARATGRPVAASPLLTTEERALLGSDWTLAGVDYRSGAPAAGVGAAVGVDRTATLRWIPALPAYERDANAVDGATGTMLSLLECPRLARPEQLAPLQRDSLEVRCNFR